MKPPMIGVLAFHGDVAEHMEASENAAKNLHLPIQIRPVRTKEGLAGLKALIIPGGESTTLYTLCMREGMFEKMKTVPALFGTCAGAILLAKHVHHLAPGQQTLERMDITVDRNAYGRQTDSFEKNVSTTLGAIPAIFIRAPKIKKAGKSVTILAKDGGHIIACQERSGDQYLLACAFHPEMTTSIFHEHFLSQALG